MGEKREEKIKPPEGLSGVPKPLWRYYIRYGLPGKVLSIRESEAKDTTYISILFKDHPFRHRWCSDPKRNTKFSTYRDPDGDWVLEQLPL